jgi:hypothetical protein
MYYLFDSHSRDEACAISQTGTAVVSFCNSLEPIINTVWHTIQSMIPSVQTMTAGQTYFSVGAIQLDISVNTDIPNANSSTGLGVLNSVHNVSNHAEMKQHVPLDKKHKNDITNTNSSTRLDDVNSNQNKSKEAEMKSHVTLNKKEELIDMSVKVDVPNAMSSARLDDINMFQTKSKDANTKPCVPLSKKEEINTSQ